MGKQETINQLMPLYLKGKSERMKERFMAKDQERQYNSLINWQSRMAKRKREQNPAEFIAQAIEKLRSEIRNARSLKNSDFDYFKNEIQSLIGELDAAETRIRASLINQLEQQQAEITKKLNELKERY
ncbi:MAG: hypothetical protein J6C81_08945 [Muribaculaceae bacterium]|nr:hypothetical protein [Muribaculaceae bacterium]